MLFRTKMVAAFAVGLVASTNAFADAIIPINDALPTCDGYFASCRISIGFDINFYGATYSDFISIGGGIQLYHDSFYDNYRMIAPFHPFSTGGDSYGISYPKENSTYGYLLYNGRPAIAVTWTDIQAHPNVNITDIQHFGSQLVLVDRSDISAGDFDFIFNFNPDSIQWNDEKYTAFFGYATDAHITNDYGYMTKKIDTLLLPYDVALLPYSSSELAYNSLNSDVAGRYVFEVRNGVVTNPLPPLTPLPLLTVPEPETWAMLLAGLGIVTGVARRRTKMAG